MESKYLLLIYLTVGLFLCLIAGKIVKQFKLPNVTGYIIMGLIVGLVLGTHQMETLFGENVAEEMVSKFDVIKDLATGFIAFSIGTEFEFKYIKKLGSSPVVIACCESVGAVVFVALGIYIVTGNIQLALIMGAIAAATDPAATILVARQYKAKGIVTRTLIPVVAIDDATALMSYGICVALARSLTGQISAATFIEPIKEIFGSLAFGILLGVIFTILIKFYTGRGNRLAITIAMVSLCVAVSHIEVLSFSPLLACMALSITVVNISHNWEPVFEQMDRMTPPIFMLFFFVTGAGMDISILPKVGLIGVVYIIVRVIGKMAGAYLGGRISHADKNVQKYLGIGLIPQAGVAIGLAMMCGTVVPEYASEITAVVVCGTIIYELVGPIFTKIMLVKIGEIKQ
ncbi:cation:proton antiporter [uncultured Eubacterium sp.]|uniref:cation:proton antiporter n=1 Tax=uncultured Eubacterium sp. TaxID=165185 RepID=UPI002673BF2F|nr:cation:proton antiporter [uncultured Eubacterium sp.]